MGVGVFSSDFDGRGVTFIVDGPLTDSDDYQSYLAALIEDHDEIVIDQAADGAWNFRHQDDPVPDPDDSYWACGQHDSKTDAFKAAAEKYDIHVMDEDAHSQDVYDSENERFIEIIRSAATELGAAKTSGGRGGRFGGPSADFDSDFVLVAEGEYFNIAWRSWEHDFVVAVSADLREAGDWFEDQESAESFCEVVSNIGLLPEQAADLINKLNESVAGFLRAKLIEDGVECRFKTSGYTTSAYQMDASEIPAYLEKTKADIARLVSVLTASAEDNLAAMTRPQRIEFLKEALRAQAAGVELPFRIEVPVFQCDETSAGHGLSYDPKEGEILSSFLLSEDVDASVAAVAARTPHGAIPFTQATEPFFSGRLRKTFSERYPSTPIMFFGADEFVLAADEPCRLFVFEGDEEDPPSAGVEIDRRWYGRINAPERSDELEAELQFLGAGQTSPCVQWGRYDSINRCYWISMSEPWRQNLLSKDCDLKIGSDMRNFGWSGQHRRVQIDALVEGFPVTPAEMTQGELQACVARGMCARTEAFKSLQTDLFPLVVDAESVAPAVDLADAEAVMVECERELVQRQGTVADAVPSPAKSAVAVLEV